MFLGKQRIFEIIKNVITTLYKSIPDIIIQLVLSIIFTAPHAGSRDVIIRLLEICIID